MGWFETLVGVAAVVVTGGAAAPFVAGVLGGGAIATAVATFAVQALTTYAVSSLITKQLAEDAQGGASQAPTAQLGSRVAANASTTNKLPIIYGNAYMPPIVVDAKISVDQQYMWYVLAYSEVTDTGTFSFDNPDDPGYPLAYWGDKLIQFDTTDKTRVTGLVDYNTGEPVTDTKVNGKIYIYFYRDGSESPLYGAPYAYNVLSDSSTGGGINPEERWDFHYLMEKTVFAVVRIQYDQDAGTTGLDTLTAYVRNSLNVPGDVMYDYMTNERYGCGIEPSLIDEDALLNGPYSLNAYSNELITYTDNGVEKSQPRYRINGPVSTTSNCLNNLTQLTESCDSWLQWDETEGQWSVVINRSVEQAGLEFADLYTVYADLMKMDQTSYPSTRYGYIAGGVDITPMDLSANYNTVTVQFPSKWIKDQVDYAYIDLPANLFNPNEPINNLTITLPYVNDDVQAQYLGIRRLEMARDDLVVTLTTDYSGIQVDAGDVIRVYHDFYGWGERHGFPYGKLFRVVQVQETLSQEGTLLAKLTLSEYNDTIYEGKSINAFQPSPNTGLTDPTVITAPGVPTITNVLTTQAIPSFDISVVTPSTGSAISLEYWYALAQTSTTPSSSSFYLLDTQYPATSAIYPNGVTVTRTISSIPAAPTGFSYYFKVRAGGTITKSPFSGNSTSFAWGPNPTATIIGSNFSTSFQPSPVTIGVYANGEPNYSNVAISLFGLVGPAIADFTTVTTNSAMANSSWRVDSPNITTKNISIGTVAESVDLTYAVWSNISNLTANVATVTVPIFYKDSTGVMHQSPSAIVNVNKTLPGQDGTRGVVTLAYVPVTYDPRNASDTLLSGSFFTTTGFNPPITNDGAVFYVQANGLISTKKYSSSNNHWYNATLEVPGNVLVANSVSGDKVAANAITSNNISSNAVTTVHLASDSVSSSKIQNDAVNTVHLSADSVTANKITANAITTNKISANAVTATHVSSATIESRHMTSNSITSGSITANSIIASKIDANAIETVHINAGAVTADKIAANSITTDKLAANFIYAGNISSFNADFGSNTSPGFWFDSTNGTAHFGNTLSVGLLIEASQLRGNVVTAENLVIGSVTQSRSSTSNPQMQLAPYYNWPAGTTNASWPDNTRSITPPSGVTIIPTTDPTSSANVEYTQGSRIEVGISVKLYANVSANLQAYNLVEVWKSGATSYYNKGYNTLRHSYDVTVAQNRNQTLHAYGFGGTDKISYDGGATWSDYNNSTADRTITGAVNYYSTYNTYTFFNTTVVGPLQTTSYGGGGTPTANWGQRLVTTPLPPTNQPINYYWATASGTLATNYLYTSWQDMAITPATGSKGSYSSTNGLGLGTFVCGFQGTIMFRYGGDYANTTIGPGYYSGWQQESTGGLLYTLNSVYANWPSNDTARNYTAVCVGDNGTILVSNRTWSIYTYSWSSKPVYKLGTTQDLLNNLYDVAGDDSRYSSSSKWVAVGQYGTIVVSTDNGANWTQVETPVPNNLNAVRYGGGKWVACGDGGVILTSTDAFTWTQIQSTLTTKDLLTIDYGSVYNTFNIGGQDGIYNSSATTLNFKFATGSTISLTKAYNLTRLAFWGSNPDTSDKTIPTLPNQLINGQIISGTIVDTAYSANVPTTYYLVVGNMRGEQIYVGQTFINATEVKR